MTQEELQKLLTSFEQEVGHVKEWQIERNEQLKSVSSLGGTKTLSNKGYTDIQKKGTDTLIEKQLGIHDKDNPNYIKWKSNGGLKGSEEQMKNAIGIHTNDTELRREWSKLGGLKVISELNRERECPYCGIKTRGAAYNRWHGENCKHKK